jgi:hypothetical protein
MNEVVEIDLRNIIHKNTSILETKEPVELTGMSLEEVMLLEREEEPTLRVFDEKLFDRMVGEIYLYMKHGRK